jgi:hypothetical protein
VRKPSYLATIAARGRLDAPPLTPPRLLLRGWEGVLPAADVWEEPALPAEPPAPVVGARRHLGASTPEMVEPVTTADKAAPPPALAPSPTPPDNAAAPKRKSGSSPTRPLSATTDSIAPSQNLTPPAGNRGEGQVAPAPPMPSARRGASENIDAPESVSAFRSAAPRVAETAPPRAPGRGLIAATPPAVEKPIAEEVASRTRRTAGVKSERQVDSAPRAARGDGKKQPEGRPSRDPMAAISQQLGKNPTVSDAAAESLRPVARRSVPVAPTTRSPLDAATQATTTPNIAEALHAALNWVGPAPAKKPGSTSLGAPRGLFSAGAPESPPRSGAPKLSPPPMDVKTPRSSSTYVAPNPAQPRALRIGAIEVQIDARPETPVPILSPPSPQVGTPAASLAVGFTTALGLRQG